MKNNLYRFTKGLTYLKSIECLIVVPIVFSLNSCIDTHDTFRSKELISSKGEKIYINTLNWGVTDDNQYTVVSVDRNRLKERKDTIDGVYGLTPFIYKFSNDTLAVFFQKEKKIDFRQEFNTVEVKYFPLENRDYIELLSSAKKGEGGYHLVPE